MKEEKKQNTLLYKPKGFQIDHLSVLCELKEKFATLSSDKILVVNLKSI